MDSGIVRAASDLRTCFRANHRKQSLTLMRTRGYIISVLCLRTPDCHVLLVWETKAKKTMPEQFPFRELLLADLDVAVDLGPKYGASTYHKRALACIRMGQYSRAMADLTQAFQISPTNTRHLDAIDPTSEAIVDSIWACLVLHLLGTSKPPLLQIQSRL